MLINIWNIGDEISQYSAIQSNKNLFGWNNATIYNSYLLLASSPLAPNGNSSLDEFVLEGWDGAGDNMAVDVNGKGEMGITGLNGVGKIPLRAVGDAQG